MSKELFIAAHEELIAEYLDKNPCATEDEAYGMTCDLAWDRLRDNLADRADYLRMRAKEQS